MFQAWMDQVDTSSESGGTLPEVAHCEGGGMSEKTGMEFDPDDHDADQPEDDDGIQEEAHGDAAEAVDESLLDLGALPSPPQVLPGPELFLIVNHISKRQNVRDALIAAAAFGAHVIVVQQPHFAIKTHIPTALRGKLWIKRIDPLERCRDWLHARGVRILGVEIMEGAKDIDEEPFDGPTAFIMGNEGTGLSARQARICDDFVFISQFGRGTASLNVAVAASIVMHRFSVWSGNIAEGRSGLPRQAQEHQGDPVDATGVAASGGGGCAVEAHVTAP